MRIVTCALPYANGDLHLGHLLEYVMGDIHVRSLRAAGQDAILICADDVHGTPIELAARTRGIEPEQLAQLMIERHREDFSAYRISFDAFGSTHSPENKRFAEEFFAAFKDADAVEKRTIEQLYDPEAERFLPDRYVKGTCPNCKAEDQYGDSCEKCGAHYKTTDLIEPRSAISGATPELRETEHWFFRLSDFSSESRAFLKEADLQPSLVKYIENWIEEGLADWDITRDGPYFGFEIPGEQGKYFYVWLDAPIGYLSTVEQWAHSRGIDNPWNDASITHVIGKDIIYFHFLFWPQMLRLAGYRQPDRIQVHGFLTVDGQKMSKSRGTFVLARELADRYDPDLVRFYLARKISKASDDDDFSFAELEQRVNNELIGNLLNLTYRTLTLLSKRDPIEVRRDLFEERSEQLIGDVLEHRNAFEALCADFEISKATAELLKAGDLVNAYVQERQPWREDDNSATLATAWTACLPIIEMLEIITPGIAQKLREQFSIEHTIRALNAAMLIEQAVARETLSAEPAIIVHKLEEREYAIEQLDLRVARIVKAREHPNADKLYLLDLDVGEERTIVSGLRGHYDLEELEGKRIAIVANLKPATIRGETSEGMLLAGSVGKGDGERVVLCEPAGEPGDRIRAGGRSAPAEQVSINDVMKAKLRVEGGLVRTDVGVLRSLHGPVTCEIDDGAAVR